MPNDYDTALAIQHAAKADQRIAKQLELIARLAEGGHNTTDALAVLAFMLDALEQMGMHRRHVNADQSTGTNTDDASPPDDGRWRLWRGQRY